MYSSLLKEHIYIYTWVTLCLSFACFFKHIFSMWIQPWNIIRSLQNHIYYPFFWNNFFNRLQVLEVHGTWPQPRGWIPVKEPWWFLLVAIKELTPPEIGERNACQLLFIDRSITNQRVLDILRVSYQIRYCYPLAPSSSNVSSPNCRHRMRILQDAKLLLRIICHTVLVLVPSKRCWITVCMIARWCYTNFLIYAAPFNGHRSTVCAGCTVP